MLFSRRRVVTLALVAALLGLAPAGGWAQRYVNVVNQKFATVSNGPQSSLIVDVPAGASRAAVTTAVDTRVRADWGARARAAKGQIAALRRAGILKGDRALPITTLVTVRQGGRLVLPERKTRQAGGGLTFSYTGWDAPSEAFLRDFQTKAYPLIQNLYGAPAWNGTVEVVNAGRSDGTQISDVRLLAFGTYDVTNGRILLPVYVRNNSVQLEDVKHAFLLLMINAFHGPLSFQYDAWEQGFARAAAAILSRDPILGFADPTANFLYSLLQFYDLLNQPPLGNPTFFPPSQANVSLEGFSIGKMFLARFGMSGAAWQKVYIENQNFFRQFNAAYYAQYDANAQPKLSGNVPALRTIAASVAPTVEGLPFAQWFERQYILDSSVSLGNRLYAFVIPSQLSGQDGQSASIILIYFRTRGDGDEELLAGRGYATYFDADNARVTLGGASEQTAIAEGEGFLTTLAFPTPGFDSGRIVMDFTAGNETARTYLPSGFTGDFQAVVLGTKTGGVTVTQTSLPPVQTRTRTANLENGGVGVALGTPLSDLAVTVVEVTDENNVRTTHRINTGDGQYYAVIRLNGTVQQATRSFPAGLSLVSFPVRPLQTDVAAALGLSPADFLLSYWNPTLPGYQTFASGQPTGPTVAPIQYGRGYWLKVAPASGATQLTVNLNGYAPTDDTDVTVSAPFGWNLIGTPWPSGTNVTDLLVKYLQNEAVDWETAVSNNYVAALPFGYTPGTGYGTVTRLEPWSGYWVRVLVPSGVTLIVPHAGRGRATGRASAPTAPRPEWSVRLRARTDAGQATAHLGAAQGAGDGFDNRFDQEAPPPIAPALSVEFPHANWGDSGGRYIADYRAPASARAVWNVSVTAPTDGEVTLTWDGLGSVPRRTRLSLIDTTTGRKTFLGSRSSYRFTAAAGQSRAFEIVAEPERTAPLAISDVTVVKTRGAAGGFAIAYAVNGAAEVTVDVKTIGGRAVRRLGGGRAQAAGRQTVVWDGRNNDGASLPVGPYTITITARDDQGALVQQSRPVLVLR